jgi:hypothetical protein
MGLKFFADHCISNSIIQGLLDAGHEVFRLKDHIPKKAPVSGLHYSQVASLKKLAILTKDRKGQSA